MTRPVQSSADSTHVECAAEALERVLIVRIAASIVALPLDGVVETLRPLATKTLGAMPSFVLGVSIVRGTPIAVIDLAQLLTGSPSSPTRWVLVRLGERRCALAVDSVIGIRELAADAVAALPSFMAGEGPSGIARIGRLDRELAMLLDAPRAIPEKLLASIANEGAS